MKAEVRMQNAERRRGISLRAAQLLHSAFSLLTSSTRSIRWRLQLWHGLILLLVLTGFGFTAHPRLCAHANARGVGAKVAAFGNFMLGKGSSFFGEFVIGT